MSQSPGLPRALALDLGSTRFKLGVLDEDGCLADVWAVPAPEAHGRGLVCELDPRAVAERVGQLFARVRAGRGTAVGLASQRSSFLAWHRVTGQPLSPVCSWQDRRAAQWCADHASLQAEIGRITGLVLSPHYVGPKLAVMQGDDARLRRAIHAGEALVGTLDAWFASNFGVVAAHQSDLSMAARTAMVDLATGDWSQRLLNVFDVPRDVLPDIVPTSGRHLELTNGCVLTASVADQAGGALVSLAPDADSVWVNFGTGAFVLAPATGDGPRPEGYLAAPIYAGPDGPERCVLEGTINGAGPALDTFGPGPTELPATDPAPAAFALPDRAGLGAPYWRAEIGLTLSAEARALPDADRRRIVLEGLLFRVAGIVQDLAGSSEPSVLISGGLAGEPGLAAGLAVLLGRPVGILDEPEATLLGVARLAARIAPFGGSPIRTAEPGANGAYLPDKFVRWQDWLVKLLNNGIPAGG